MSGPTTTNLIESDASDPTLSTTSKPGRLGHLDLVGKGLVAMYPKSPSRKCGRRSDHGPRRMAWNTKLWVVEWTNKKVEMEGGVGLENDVVGRDWERRGTECSRTVEDEA